MKTIWCFRRINRFLNCACDSDFYWDKGQNCIVTWLQDTQTDSVWQYLNALLKVHATALYWLQMHPRIFSFLLLFVILFARVWQMNMRLSCIILNRYVVKMYTWLLKKSINTIQLLNMAVYRLLVWRILAWPKYYFHWKFWQTKVLFVSIILKK